MKRSVFYLVAFALTMILSCSPKEPGQNMYSFPEIGEKPSKGGFPLAAEGLAATLCYDAGDAEVVGIASRMLAEDIERVTGLRPDVIPSRTATLPEGPLVIAGTLGASPLVDRFVKEHAIDVERLRGKWESFLIRTITNGNGQAPVLLVVGSDRRGTAFGLTTLSEAIGVSPWYFWADVPPQTKKSLYVPATAFFRDEPDVKYRGIFINDERFGGWARWVENNFDKESGQVGPKVYEKVFELLLRLRANYLWPAMHNGSKAFNADPRNARLADAYAIVMGSSHCEQMLRNNEDEWKNAGTWGDFNYITNRGNMIRYWEERVQANGGYEKTYTLGLRGIHDYPMEGANTTEERRDLMQQAIDDQRAILERNIDKPLEEIPQVLCTYEEVLDAYHAGLKVPEDVILLWSDDKQGYTRNLCNPGEMGRKGGAGIYYHLSYHGDPASWLWLSPLSPAFISEELTKAYTYGAQKLWIFNVGDIKPAEKEITFAMELAWDLDRWTPEKAHGFIEAWAERTFGKPYAREIAAMQAEYYRLQAAGKDAHVWFLEYPEPEIRQRLADWQQVADQASELEKDIPEPLKAAYFELVHYPIRGAWLLNEYQLRARLSMAEGARGEVAPALEDARKTAEMFAGLNEWTRYYNEGLLDGKWNYFFNWRPYHWYYSDRMDAPVFTEELISQVKGGPAPRLLSAESALSQAGVRIESDKEGEIPLWIHALTPVQHFSKLPQDNIFCRVAINGTAFDASATPINNVWHSPLIGPMWSQVGTIHLKKGENRLYLTDLRPQTQIGGLYIGLYPPFPEAPRLQVPAKDYQAASREKIVTIPQLGFSPGVMVLPYGASCSENEAPYVEYELDLKDQDKRLEIRTLPTLHVYEGRQVRYAVSLDGAAPEVFSIHTEDFTPEWRWNVLRGYSCRSVSLEGLPEGPHTVRVSLMDPGLVLQELRVY